MCIYVQVGAHFKRQNTRCTVLLHKGTICEGLSHTLHCKIGTHWLILLGLHQSHAVQEICIYNAHMSQSLPPLLVELQLHFLIVCVSVRCMCVSYNVRYDTTIWLLSTIALLVISNSNKCKGRNHNIHEQWSLTPLMTWDWCGWSSIQTMSQMPLPHGLALHQTFIICK